MTARAFVTNPDDAPAFWHVGNLWRLMASGVQTGNSFCMLDQLLAPETGGPCTHTHTQDEGLYVVSGHCTFRAGGAELAAGPGSFVAVPRLTEHAFEVDAPGTQLLNFYTPAGFELILMGIAEPAERSELPPGLGKLAPRKLVENLSRDYGMKAAPDLPFVDRSTADNTRTQATPGATALPFSANARTAPTFWHEGGSWAVLADASATDGTYSLLERTLPQGFEEPCHVHLAADEVLYLLEGGCDVMLGEQLSTWRKGGLVFVPRGTAHRFRVVDGPARILDLYTPGGFERSVTTLGAKVAPQTVPPADWKQSTGPEADELYSELRTRWL